MNKLTLITALIATTLSSAAVASDWVLVGAGIDGTTFYVDRESIRTQPNGYKRAWRRTIYGEPNEFGDTSSEVFVEFGCKESRSRFLRQIYFKGTQITDSVSGTTEWKYARPDSAGEILLEYVCFGTVPTLPSLPSQG